MEQDALLLITWIKFEHIDCVTEVYVFGRGEYGRLGLGDSSSSSKLRPCKLPGLEGHKIVQASCGGPSS